MSKTLYNEIKEYLNDVVSQNQTNPNFKLPSENQLAIKFNTTRITAKKALTLLENEGKIRCIHGKGSYINAESQNLTHISKKDFVCLLLPNVHSDFITEIISGVNDYIESTGIQLFILSNSEKYLMDNNVYMKLVNMGARGFIVFPFDNLKYSKDLMILALNNFPVVFIDRTLKNFELSAVTSKHLESAKEATSFLISKGCKKVGFISTDPESSSAISRRLKGYEAALLENEQVAKNISKLFVSEADPNLVEQIIDFLHNNRFDGVLSSGDKIGLALMKAVKKMKLSIPDDLQIIFYDDEYKDIADVIPFAPTCIKQNGFKIGSEATRILTNLVRTNSSVQERVYIETTLLERESTKK